MVGNASIMDVATEGTATMTSTKVEALIAKALAEAKLQDVKLAEKV